MIKATEVNLAAVSDRTIIIPGHGAPVSNRGELVAYRDMLIGICGNVAKLKQRGRSLDEIIAARPTQNFDAKWAKSVIAPDFFTRLAYAGVYLGSAAHTTQRGVMHDGVGKTVAGGQNGVQRQRPGFRGGIFQPMPAMSRCTTQYTPRTAPRHIRPGNSSPICSGAA